jgi:two-component system sensor histidine kinase KdpD
MRGTAVNAAFVSSPGEGRGFFKAAATTCQASRLPASAGLYCGMAMQRRNSRTEPLDPRPYLMALAIVAVGLGVAKLIHPWLGIENVDLVFLTAVVGVAVRFGLWPSLLASVAASLCYNFFFLPPIHTFTITDPTNIAAFFFFMLIAVLVSSLAARVRNQAMSTMGSLRTTELLYTFSRKLAGTATLDDVLWASAHQTALMLRVRVVLLLSEGGVLSVKAGYPPEDELDNADLAAANQAWTNDRPAGRGSDTLPGARRLFLPMRTGRGVIGVIGIDDDRSGPLLTPDQRRLLDALVDQSALAIERVLLVEDMDRVRRTVESDRLRTALLTSISHDLKTPLASVLGSASTLKNFSANLSEAEKADLLATIIDESERLNRFIANLLDMTKLESGAIVPNTSRHDLGEIVGSALRRAGKILVHHKVRLELQPGLPMLELDAVLFEQVLFNLLDNAAKYAPEATTIALTARRDDNSVLLQIIDEGSGIPQDELESVFDKFYRAQKTDHVRAGTGLGLAISRGFVEAMHGTIVATNRSDRNGAVITIRLPVAPDAEALDTAA